MLGGRSSPGLPHPTATRTAHQRPSDDRFLTTADLLRRTATDLLRRAAVDPVAAKAIIGHTTDRMREHYSTVNAEETRDIGTRVASLVPAVRLNRGGWSTGWSARYRVSGTPPNTLVTNRNHFVYRRAGEGI